MSDRLVSDDEYEYLDTVEGAPYGHTTEFGYPTAVIGEDPGTWYFAPDDLRRIADEVEIAHSHAEDGTLRELVCEFCIGDENNVVCVTEDDAPLCPRHSREGVSE